MDRTFSFPLRHATTFSLYLSFPPSFFSLPLPDSIADQGTSSSNSCGMGIHRYRTPTLPTQEERGILDPVRISQVRPSRTSRFGLGTGSSRSPGRNSKKGGRQEISLRSFSAWIDSLWICRQAFLSRLAVSLRHRERPLDRGPVILELQSPSHPVPQGTIPRESSV